jgi:hypothetical protein
MAQLNRIKSFTCSLCDEYKKQERLKSAKKPRTNKKAATSGNAAVPAASSSTGSIECAIATLPFTTLGSLKEYKRQGAMASSHNDIEMLNRLLVGCMQKTMSASCSSLSIGNLLGTSIVSEGFPILSETTVDDITNAVNMLSESLPSNGISFCLLLLLFKKNELLLSSEVKELVQPLLLGISSLCSSSNNNNNSDTGKRSSRHGAFDTLCDNIIARQYVGKERISIDNLLAYYNAFRQL